MKNQTNGRFLAIIFTSALVAGQGYGAFTVTETTDYSGNLGSPFIVPEPLGYGANTISGTLPANVDFGYSEADGDVFYVNNPDGLTVTSITVDISNFVGTTTNPEFGAGTLRLEAPGFDQHAVYNNGQFTLVPSPSDASVFEFRFFGPEDFMNFENREVGSMDYLVTLNAVPEPTTGLLFGAFAVGATMIRRRKG